MDDDDLLSGLNELTENADQPEIVKKAARESKKAQQTTEDQSNNDAPSSSSGGGTDSKVDGSAISADAIQDKMAKVQAQVEQKKKDKTSAPIKLKKSGQPDGQKAASPSNNHTATPDKVVKVAKQPKASTPPSIPIAIMAVIAGMLVIFAIGMGYGVIVASHHFPYWYHNGIAGSLSDWIAAPTGVLLFPVLSGIFYFAGRELHTSDDLKAAKFFYGLSAIALIIALALPVVV